MKLSENPIFITHKRLVHRGGVLAAAIIAALIGFSLLAGLISSLAVPQNFHFGSRADAGRAFYGWIIAVEILVLVIGGFSRVSRTLGDDRKAGLWDSNRLTPLPPAQIIAGYWFAPALREFYMAVVLAGFGLLMVAISGLPLALWLGTQTLIGSTALFFGLLGILAGMVFQRVQGLLIVLAFLFAYPFSFLAPSRMLTNFLLPIHGIGHLFQAGQSGGEPGWDSLPAIFGVPVYSVLLTVGLQFIIGLFVWRALVRKTARPFQPLLLRWEAVALFLIVIGSQHGLLWDLWHGNYPFTNHHYNDERQSLLCVVHGGTIFIGVVLLAFASPMPESVRVESLRLNFKNLGAVMSRSSVSLAVVLGLIASAAMFTQFMFSPVRTDQIALLASLSLLEIFLTFALLLEFCRLRFKRRAIGFIALWVTILCVLPFILAAVFASEGWTRLSLLAPGFVALGNWESEAGLLLWYPLLAHGGVVFLLFLAWRREWKRLLAQNR